MTAWIRYILPTAAIMSTVSPAYSVQYLSIEEAQKQAFPSARFVEVQPGRVWKAESGGRTVGFFVFDRVIGKHLFIDYAVALTPGRGRPQRRNSAISGVLRRRNQESELAGTVRWQDQRQCAQGQQRHPQYRRRDPVFDACRRGRQESTRSLW